MPRSPDFGGRGPSFTGQTLCGDREGLVRSTDWASPMWLTSRKRGDVAVGLRRCDVLPVRRSRGPVGRVAGLSRVMGTRTAWTGVGDGEFFCPGCGGDRNYQRLTGRRRFTLLGVPVLSRGET